MALLGAAAGCGSDGGTSAAASGDEATSAATVAAGDASTTTTATATTSGGSGSPVSVPVAVEHRYGDSSEGYMAIVEATIGGGSPVLLVLDTGSTGLVVDAAAVGSGATTPSGSSPTSIQYDGTSVEGPIEQASFEIGGVSTAQPIDVLVATSCDVGTTPEPCSNVFYGASGILGVAATDGSGADDPYSPLLQLPSPYDQGFTVDITGGPGSTGSLVLGPVAPPAGAVALPLGTSSPPATYASGTTAWNKDPQLCWTIGSGAETCGPTDLDLGMEAPQVTAGVGGAPSSGTVPGGTAVSISPSAGAAPIWQFTSSGTTASEEVVASSTLGVSEFNTGIGFYFANVVAFDMVDGQILVSPASS